MISYYIIVYSRCKDVTYCNNNLLRENHEFNPIRVVPLTHIKSMLQKKISSARMPFQSTLKN